MGVKQKIFLDSCILIYLVEQHPQYALMLSEKMHQFSDSAFYISPLVKMECLILPFKNRDTDIVKRYQAFFNQYETLPLAEDIFIAAAALRAAHSIKTPDALHLATAQYYECDALWTNDHQFYKAAPQLIKPIFN